MKTAPDIVVDVGVGGDLASMAAGTTADHACFCSEVRTLWKKNERACAQTVGLNYTSSVGLLAARDCNYLIIWFPKCRESRMSW